MDIQRETPMPSRPCQYCLCLQNGAVFADFDLDTDGCIYLVRISFDGYGCCHLDRWSGITRMDAETSRRLIKSIKKNRFNACQAAEILSQYFNDNKAVLWADALEQHNLV